MTAGEIEQPAAPVVPGAEIESRRSDAVATACDPDDGGHLLIDQLSSRLDSLALLNEHDISAFDSALETFGTHGLVEQQMVTELSSTEPLAHPERFDEAHRRAVRALEVFDRNGARPPSVLPVWAIARRPAAKVVQLLTTAIVRNHQKRLIRDLRQLYALREANSATDSPQHLMLSRARTQMDAFVADLNKSSLPLPAFLVGGAAISGTLSVIRSSFNADWSRYLFSAAFLVLGLVAFWCILKAAGIARRRTRIALDQSVKALYEVIGSAGSPPHDHSKLFATIATVLLVAVWIVVPAVVASAAITWPWEG